ncbi:TrbC/VirB2 family protein [Acidocella aminolytica]|uniref:Conjugal transfer protein TrbC n=1 Tax=Acidocella aminolytica 101 = DSM 11237 TaxID=1120923 RepID=A0A0D6PGP0_9PROT|nr:TrbC/VirB2 family protein [Acidocella aminolytica]GAN80368.1 conjugal transfer protein TrbC [Acidocella aminolytica 101 = DSM 11237]SHF60451.1 type IV secretion system protein VirB2 [Acidocella aminolytica 101 = DSM 11237]
MRLFDRVRRLSARAGMSAVVMAAMSRAALAASTGGGGSNLPFMGPLQSIENTITGPFAYAITMIGLVMAGAGLVFFGEMSEFMRRLLYVVMAGSLLLGASQIVALFSGAVI